MCINISELYTQKVFDNKEIKHSSTYAETYPGDAIWKMKRLHILSSVNESAK